MKRHRPMLAALALLILIGGNVHAAAPPDDSEQVLLPGDERILQPIDVEITAVYSGIVSKSSVRTVLYTVTYTGYKLPLAPFLPPEVTVPQVVIVVGLLALLLAALVFWFVRYHIARVYVYNEERRIHDVVGRQYVRVKAPKLRLNALRGHAEAEYTVILRKRLAKRLVGRDIAVETGGEGQHHIVESFVGSDYAFSVHL